MKITSTRVIKAITSYLRCSLSKLKLWKFIAVILKWTDERQEVLRY